MRRPTSSFVGTALTATLLLVGCSSAPASDAGGRLTATVGLYPYAWVLERIGGDDVVVHSLAAPGMDAHDLELRPQQVAAVADSDLVVVSPGFQPALDDAVEQQAPDRAIDVLSLVEVRDDGGSGSAGHEDDATGHDDQGTDPHVWLDPARLSAIATALADALVERAPETAAQVRERADALTADLRQLDEDYRAGLADCARRDVVTSHDAFGYLTERYDLRQLPLAGRSGEDEPSPRRLAEVARAAQAGGVTTVFHESTGSPRLAEQLAREIGARTAPLDPLESAPPEGDYLSAMRANLATLRTALDCT